MHCDWYLALAGETTEREAGTWGELGRQHPKKWSSHYAALGSRKADLFYNRNIWIWTWNLLIFKFSFHLFLFHHHHHHHHHFHHPHRHHCVCWMKHICAAGLALRDGTLQPWLQGLAWGALRPEDFLDDASSFHSASFTLWAPLLSHSFSNCPELTEYQALC